MTGKILRHRVLKFFPEIFTVKWSAVVGIRINILRNCRAIIHLRSDSENLDVFFFKNCKECIDRCWQKNFWTIFNVTAAVNYRILNYLFRFM